MSRQITPEEIERLVEYNKTHKYVSIEAYQDLLDWMPDEDNAPVPAEKIPWEQGF